MASPVPMTPAPAPQPAPQPQPKPQPKPNAKPGRKPVTAEPLSVEQQTELLRTAIENVAAADQLRTEAQEALRALYAAGHRRLETESGPVVIRERKGTYRVVRGETKPAQEPLPVKL